MPEAIPVVGGVIGGIMGSDSASDAAKAQEKAANQAADAQLEAARMSTDEIRRQFDLSRQDQLPWLNTGSAALNRLATLMGVVPQSTSAAPTMLTEAQIREELAPQFSGSQGAFQGGGSNMPPLGPGESYGVDPRTGQLSIVSWTNPGGHGEGNIENRAIYRAIDQSGMPGSGGGNSAFEDAVQKRLAQQQQEQQQWQAQQAAQGNASRKDPLFGSLMNRFSMKDYVEDPGYKFRLGQGEQAINRAAAAAGRYDSGRALKDLTEFNSGLASQEYGNAYSRFVNDQSNQFNRLAGLAGVGQTAANSLSELGSGAANNIGNLNMAGGNAAAAGAINAGNAAASGKIGSANAWSNALGGATNALAQYFQPSFNVGSGFNMGGFGSGMTNQTFSARF